MTEYLVRFAIGGLVVSLFAMLGDVFRPKSFAGSFGAAPSIALATLGLTVAHEGRAYAAIEARSMMLGAAAFCVYSVSVSWALMRGNWSSLKATVALIPIWVCVAVGACVLIGWSR